MDINDRAEFRGFIDGLCAAYGRDKLPMMAVQIYFDALSKYPLSNVMAAASAHLTDVERGTFFPKVADIVRGIEGGTVTTDNVISQARLANTPMGVLCRIQIGSFDLNNQTDMFYLKQRAQECIDLIPEWKARAAMGDYSDHEISMMIKHDVSPTDSFTLGMVPAHNKALAHRAGIIKSSEQHKLALVELHEQTDDDKKEGIHEDVAKRLREIVG